MTIRGLSRNNTLGEGKHGLEFPIAFIPTGSSNIAFNQQEESDLSPSTHAPGKVAVVKTVRLDFLKWFS
jgi:hypothetical protein